MKKNADGSLVMLDRGVQCKTTAYMDAYMIGSASRFVGILSIGIYGMEDLSTRCVREQKNTTDNVLDETITSVIEGELLQMLDAWGKDDEEVKWHIRKRRIYHHAAITSAKTKWKKHQSRSRDNSEREVAEQQQQQQQRIAEQQRQIEQEIAERQQEMQQQNSERRQSL